MHASNWSKAQLTALSHQPLHIYALYSVTSQVGFDCNKNKYLYVCLIYFEKTRCELEEKEILFFLFKFMSDGDSVVWKFWMKYYWIGSLVLSCCQLYQFGM